MSEWVSVQLWWWLVSCPRVWLFITVRELFKQFEFFFFFFMNVDHWSACFHGIRETSLRLVRGTDLAGCMDKPVDNLAGVWFHKVIGGLDFPSMNRLAWNLNASQECYCNTDKIIAFRELRESATQLIRIYSILGNLNHDAGRHKALRRRDSELALIKIYQSRTSRLS